jgi:ClpA/ClpB-like protein
MTAIPPLFDLIRDVLLDGAAEPRDPIRHIGHAERLAGELTHLGESLVGFFVEQARAEGLSWADIGAPRGLSRQGAQQRYGPLLTHLTVADLVEAGALRQLGEAALAALHRAEGHSARLGRDAIDSGDLLLGVLDDDESPAVAAIRELGVDPVVLRSELEQSAEGSGGPGQRHGSAAFGSEKASDTGGDQSVRSSLSVEARRTLDGALAEARGHRVGPGHLLLGMLRNPAGRAGRVLGARGITKSSAMGAILAVGNHQTAERG